MLIEFEGLRQIENEDPRRLFTDDYFSLYAWYRNGSISGFQLCYDKGQTERCLMWTSENALSHYLVDSGEGRDRGMKGTAIFAPVEATLADDLLARFEKASVSLEGNLRHLVAEKIGAFREGRAARE